MRLWCDGVSIWSRRFPRDWSVPEAVLLLYELCLHRTPGASRACVFSPSLPMPPIYLQAGAHIVQAGLTFTVSPRVTVNGSSASPSQAQSHSAVQAGLQLIVILLPQPLECWADYLEPNLCPHLHLFRRP